MTEATQRREEAKTQSKCLLIGLIFMSAAAVFMSLTNIHLRKRLAGVENRVWSQQTNSAKPKEVIVKPLLPMILHPLFCLVRFGFGSNTEQAKSLRAKS